MFIFLNETVLFLPYLLIQVICKIALDIGKVHRKDNYVVNNGKVDRKKLLLKRPSQRNEVFIKPQLDF